MLQLSKEAPRRMMIGDWPMASVIDSPISVTRVGDLLHFWQLFKACGTSILPKSPTFLGKFGKIVKIFHFASEVIFEQLL